jgi:hypothetical protein
LSLFVEVAGDVPVLCAPCASSCTKKTELEEEDWRSTMVNAGVNDVVFTCIVWFPATIGAVNQPEISSPAATYVV